MFSHGEVFRRENSGKKTAGEQSFCGVFPDVTLINDALSKDNGERSYIFTIALKNIETGQYCNFMHELASL